jgi:hypothetical protein
LPHGKKTPTNADSDGNGNNTNATPAASKAPAVAVRMASADPADPIVPMAVVKDPIRAIARSRDPRPVARCLVDPGKVRINPANR